MILNFKSLKFQTLGSDRKIHEKFGAGTFRRMFGTVHFG